MARPSGDARGTLVIVLDTNVPSAMMRVTDEPAVERWFDAQPTESVWTTTVTVFEIRFGLALLAAGRRRERLDRARSSARSTMCSAAGCCRSTAAPPRRPH